jgi:hypothetical protein
VKAVVVETNVFAVANEMADQAGPVCVLACVDAMETARRNITVLDAGNLCFDEYFRYASRSGQSKAGDAFARWLWENQYSNHCERVEITPIAGKAKHFVEFPDDPALSEFDPSDRKFVAIAKASRYKPTILNAADTDWWHHRKTLKKNGITIDFLCPALMGG